MEECGNQNACLFQNTKVEFDQQQFLETEILIDINSIKITVLYNVITLKFQDILQISSSESLMINIFMSSGSNCQILMNSLSIFETFLTILDNKIRLQNGDTATLLTSLFDIPVDMCCSNNHESYRLFKKPITPFINVSSKELKLALEIYGKSSGWFGIIQKDQQLVKKSKGIFYLIIYCVENTIFEKIICHSEGSYFFEDSPHICFTSLLALINLCKLQLSKIGKFYPLTTHLSKELLMDIQDPEVSKIFVPHCCTFC